MHKKSLVSTGQAAELCSVTPDTILKWIKARKINAVATAGGHYRINTMTLQPFMTNAPALPLPAVPPEAPTAFCWEYHIKKGGLPASCRKCVVYQSRTQRCFVIAEKSKYLGNAGARCKTSCHDCGYFAFVNKSELKRFSGKRSSSKNSLRTDKKTP